MRHFLVVLIRAIGLTSQFYSLYEKSFLFNIKRCPIFTNAVTMGHWRQISKRFGANQWVRKFGVITEFLLYAPLNVFRKRFQFTLASRSELDIVHKKEDYTSSSSRSIFSKGTHPFLLASSIASLRDLIYSGFKGSFSSISSISQPAGLINLEWYSREEMRSTSASSTRESTSRSARVSKIKSCGRPSRSIMTPALDPRSRGNADLRERCFHGTSLASDTFIGKSFFLAIHQKYTKKSQKLSNDPPAGEARQEGGKIQMSKSARFLCL